MCCVLCVVLCVVCGACCVVCLVWCGYLQADGQEVLRHPLFVFESLSHRPSASVQR